MIELFDELVGGVHEAAWPLIREEFDLSYIHIGILNSLPMLIGNLLEPALGILADVWRRRTLILAGGLVFGLALFLTGIAWGFWPLLFSFILFNPASEAFVSLSQAVLIDSDLRRGEKNMVRWGFAGSLGAAIGPLVLGAARMLGGGWRGLFLAFAVLSALLLAAIRRLPLDRRPEAGHGGRSLGFPAFLKGLRGAWTALRRRQVRRWLLLLPLADSMLDVLYGFLALYLVDAAGARIEEAALAVALWTAVRLAGELLLIPLIERVDGLSYLRVSAAITAALFPVFLAAVPLAIKLALLSLIALSTSGWYSILMARLYASMPGQSGTALAVNNVATLAGCLFPLGLAVAAQAWGLGTAMWFILAGPLALLAAVRHDDRESKSD